MPRPDALVVAEVPSLGAAVSDLLSAGGLTVETVPDLESASHRLANADERPRVFVIARSDRPSDGPRAWPDGGFPQLPIVVVGNGAAGTDAGGRIRYIPLPLSAPDLLGVVRNLAGIRSA